MQSPHPRPARRLLAAALLACTAVAHAHPGRAMELQRQPGITVPPAVIEEMQRTAPEQVTLALRVCARGESTLRVEHLRGRAGQVRPALLEAQASAEADGDRDAAARVLEYSMVLEASPGGGLPTTTLRRFQPTPAESAARAGLLVSRDTRAQLLAAFPALALDCPLSSAGTADDAERVKAALAIAQPLARLSAVELDDGALAEETFLALSRQAASRRAVDAVIEMRHHERGQPRRVQAHRWLFADEVVTLFLEQRAGAWRLGVSRAPTAPARTPRADSRLLFAGD